MHYMHYKDYIHHDFYVYSPVLLTQYLGHCWHTPCTELYILRISAWLLRKPPLPCHRRGGTIWLGEGGGVGVPAHIYIVNLNIHLLLFRSCAAALGCRVVEVWLRLTKRQSWSPRRWSQKRQRLGEDGLTVIPNHFHWRLIQTTNIHQAVLFSCCSLSFGNSSIGAAPFA